MTGGKITMMAPTGNKQNIVALAGVTEANPFVSDLLQWETAESDPQELEVLVYPKFSGEAGIAFDPATMGPCFYSVRVDFRWSMGAGTRATAIQHSTLNPLTSDPTKIRAQVFLPDHGMKFRVACRNLRLRLLVASAMSFQAVASVSPVLGGKTSPPFPQVNQLNFEPWLVPYGAREFRVLPYSIGGSGIPVGIYPGAVVQFNHPSIALPAFTALQIPAANCLDWTLIPGQAVSVQTTTESFSTIQFR